jgi:dipeptidase E
MAISILTSMFHNDFPIKFAERLNEIIVNRKNFVFIASEFNDFKENNDRYFKLFLSKFHNAGIKFSNCCIVDDRMTKEESQQAVKNADVIWISGGDTPTQFKYLKECGLDKVLNNHNGVIIGMSAGAINMAKIAICTFTCEQHQQKIYRALGLVDISVEPHFDCNNVTDELLELSNDYCIYGLCDDAAIICKDGNVELLGDIFILDKHAVKQISS